MSSPDKAPILKWGIKKEHGFKHINSMVVYPDTLLNLDVFIFLPNEKKNKAIHYSGP